MFTLPMSIGQLCGEPALTRTFSGGILCTMRFQRHRDNSAIFSFLMVIAAALAGCGDLSLDAGGTGSGFLLASSVSAGGRHTCARLSDNTVWCWGNNADGQLGDNTTAGSRVPVQVQGINTAAGISAGGNHTCSVLANGTVWCWGNNLNGQLGNGTNNDSSIPVQVSGITGASAVAAGGIHTCALLTDGTVRCWGSNVLEQLGNSLLLPGSRSNVPVTATTVSSAVEISAGANHNCVSVTSPSTRVRCWGNNFSGQLGSAWTVIFPVVETT